MADNETGSQGQQERPRWSGYVQIGLIVGAIIVALYFARAPERVQMDVATASAAQQARPAVDVIQPEITEQAFTLDLTGTVTLHGKVTVTSQAAGRIVEIAPEFKNGGTVPAGTVMVRIDPTEAELRLAVAENRVREAQAELDFAQANLAAPLGDNSRDDPGRAEREQQIRQAAADRSEAALQRAIATMELRQLELSWTEVSLPFDSRVITTDVEVGAFVGPQDIVGMAAVLGVVYRTEALQARVPINETDLASLEPVVGRSAIIRTSSQSYQATVERISSVIAPKSRLATLFLRFSDGANADSLPLPGSFAHVAISGPLHENVFVLPEATMQDHDIVWIVKDGALEAFVPRILGKAGNGVIVEAFDSFDGVIIGGVPWAREGMVVDVNDANPSS